MKVNKCNKVANEHRIAGNKLYNSSKFYEALICYNKSLCHAVPGSTEFSLGFANRSAVYMEVKEYDMCLENIQLAIDCGYPTEKRQTLIKRHEKCLDMLEIYEPDPTDNPWNFFKLSYPANKKIPWIVDCVELRETKKYGRHLVTTKALKTGDIIAIEEPFYKFLFNQARYSRCANCLQCLHLNLFPCLECTYTMFCSKKCMLIGKRFHDFECQIVDINTDEESDVFQVAHRFVFHALGMFKRISKLQKFLDDHPEPRTVFDFDFSNIDEVQTEKNLLLATNTLHRNLLPEKLAPIMDQHVSLMKSITKNPKKQKFLDDYMRRQMEVSIANQFGLNMLSFSDYKRTDIGSGIFPFASFFNHSCAPNIIRVTVDNKLAFVAARPIAKGHQLFVCYRGSFSIDERQVRQEEILKSYRFKCTCEACTKNYPILDDLPSIYPTKFIEPEPHVESMEAAKREYKNNCDYIDRNCKDYPSYEICTLISRNYRLLDSINRFAPYFP